MCVPDRPHPVTKGTTGEFWVASAVPINVSCEPTTAARSENTIICDDGAFIVRSICSLFQDRVQSYDQKFCTVRVLQ